MFSCQLSPILTRTGWKNMIELETVAKLVERYNRSHISGCEVTWKYTDAIKGIRSTPMSSFQGRFADVGRVGLHAHRLAFLAALIPYSPRQSNDKGPAFASLRLKDG